MCVKSWKSEEKRGDRQTLTWWWASVFTAGTVKRKERTDRHWPGGEPLCVHSRNSEEKRIDRWTLTWWWGTVCSQQKEWKERIDRHWPGGEPLCAWGGSQDRKWAAAARTTGTAVWPCRLPRCLRQGACPESGHPLSPALRWSDAHETPADGRDSGGRKVNMIWKVNVMHNYHFYTIHTYHFHTIHIYRVCVCVCVWLNERILCLCKRSGVITRWSAINNLLLLYSTQLSHLALF